MGGERRDPFDGPVARHPEEELPIGTDTNESMATSAPPLETVALFATISNVRLSGMPSRVTSRTLHVPRWSSKSDRIGPSSDLESVITLPVSGWKENVIVARTSTSRRNASDPGTLVSSKGAGGPIWLFSMAPEIVPGNSRSWIPNQCTHRFRRSPSTSRASARGWAPVSFAYARTNAAAAARAPVAFTASSASPDREAPGCSAPTAMRSTRPPRARRRAGQRPSVGASRSPSRRRSSRGYARDGGAGRAAAADLRIGRGKSGLRRAGC